MFYDIGPIVLNVAMYCDETDTANVSVIIINVIIIIIISLFTKIKEFAPHQQATKNVFFPVKRLDIRMPLFKNRVRADWP